MEWGYNKCYASKIILARNHVSHLPTNGLSGEARTEDVPELQHPFFNTQWHAGNEAFFHQEVLPTKTDAVCIIWRCDHDL